MSTYTFSYLYKHSRVFFLTALNLKEIPYDIKPVSLIKSGGEQHSNEFREINPMEQVPALHIDNHTLIESVSIETFVRVSLFDNNILSMEEFSFQLNILQYLEETRPHRPLMPADPVKRARVREICEVIASGIQPLQNLVVLIYVGEERKKEWAQHWITRGLTGISTMGEKNVILIVHYHKDDQGYYFSAVEKLLSSSAGKYCVGDEITLADCCLIPQIFNARRFLVDLRPFPTILRVDRHLENHPAFTAAHPNNQPDCPPEATK